MDTYKIQIDEEALKDIQNATDWYNGQEQGLGTRFQKQTKSQINALKKNAPLYAKRYADVRCMVIRKFPFMVHYTLNSKPLLVEVFAVIHTSRNPKIWEERRNNRKPG
jgi:mRNA-degrading endonuclease RelE of RelBE toxin-antitoxin system